MMSNGPLKVGDPAPAFRLPLPGRAPLTASSFAGQPLVLAFLDVGPFGSADAAQLDRARAELRGLGAALLAVCPQGLWCFRADDELQVLAAADRVDPADLDRLREDFSVPAGALGLLVLDDGRVRLVDVAPAGEWRGGHDFTALVDALAAAGRQVIAARPFTVTRRQVVLGSLTAAFAAGAFSSCHRTATEPLRPGSAAGVQELPADLEITLAINGTARRVRIDPRTTLLDALRERVGLTGTKKGCDQGQCGACTVLMDGRRVKSCLVFAVAAEGSPVVTIEGLAQGDTLHPMQAAFVEEDGFQCGYCTPGQIMSAVGLLNEAAGAELSDDDVRLRMSGNICRCGAYPNIVAAIQRARRDAPRGG